jgi:hypothetical protein
VTPSPSNRAVIAAAGSGKTEYVIARALAAPPGRRVLITTYTQENGAQILRRIREAHGCPPPGVRVEGWFSFLISQAARPYQSAVTGQADFVGTLNLQARHPQGIRRADWRRYYFDRIGDIRPAGLPEFACQADHNTGGAVIRRLEAMLDEIYIDEFQDLAGYDLDFLDLLFASRIQVTVVGDPRQHTYSTNHSPRNKQYRGRGVMNWLAQRAGTCTLEVRDESMRCNQDICDWADALYLELPRTNSRNQASTGHDSVVCIAPQDVPAYIGKYDPIILRDSKRADTMGLPAMNIGIAKGSTFDRVLIFPTKPMLRYIKTTDPSVLKAPERLYVAVTRARHSVAFVVNPKDANYVP